MSCTKNKNITKELEKLDEEIEKNDKILSKDEALKKVEEEMDLWIVERERDFTKIK